MEIYKEMLDRIADAARRSCGREIGGILGADRDGAVCRVVIDDAPSDDRYTYVPDVDRLNGILARWEPHEFIGLFHTHPNNQRTLSVGDRAYIGEIMRAMPPGKDRLCFPLYVLPEYRLYGYLAERDARHGITVTQEPVHVITV